MPEHVAVGSMSCCCLIAICFMSFAVCHILINCVFFNYSFYVCIFLVLSVFFILCVLCFCIALCTLSPHVSIRIQVYRPLPPGGNPIAVNKYHVTSCHNQIRFAFDRYFYCCLELTQPDWSHKITDHQRLVRKFNTKNQKRIFF